MGIVNVTPDSFFDGGDYTETEAALTQARRLLDGGAAIIDVGGESTRPGAQRVPAAEQKERVLPLIAAVCGKHDGIFISIDTTSSAVAEAALDAGASMLNDISAGREDPQMLDLAAQRQAPICLMHMRGEPATMQDNPQYDDVVEDTLSFLHERAEAALKAGVDSRRIVIDPGIGFGKTLEHNLLLLANLKRFVDSGYAVLLGASRKRFIAELEGGESPQQRLAGSCAATVIGLQAGVRIFRVHDAAEHRQALALAQAICRITSAP